MILKDIYNELRALRQAYETVNAEKLHYLRLSTTPIAQASKPDYTKDDEVIFDVDYAKEVEEDEAERERKLWQGTG